MKSVLGEGWQITIITAIVFCCMNVIMFLLKNNNFPLNTRHYPGAILLCIDLSLDSLVFEYTHLPYLHESLSLSYLSSLISHL